LLRYINKFLKVLNMLTVILIFDVALVAWSLHLMEEAYEHREFSLMLAGTLVALAAAAMLVVYFLMGNCMSYLMSVS
jgi:uncharacterized membrane protein YcjF (UPF0283 family)